MTTHQIDQDRWGRCTQCGEEHLLYKGLCDRCWESSLDHLRTALAGAKRANHVEIADALK